MKDFVKDGMELVDILESYTAREILIREILRKMFTGIADDTLFDIGCYVTTEEVAFYDKWIVGLR